jgi:hypothetical protein
MDLPYDRIIFFTKVLTGLVMMLNIGLVLSLRMHLRFVREARATGAQSSIRGPVVLGLAILVILINIATVYSNYQMLQAVRAIAKQA